MRAYWHGDKTVVRIPLNLMALAGEGTTPDALGTFAAGLGFPTLQDWSQQSTDGEGVLIYTPDVARDAPTVPGRDDLDAEAFVVWLRRRTVAAFFFAKTIADLTAVLALIASYEAALRQISAHADDALQLRVQQAPHTEVIITPEGEPANALQLWGHPNGAEP